MATLVPLHIDVESGRLVATGDGGGGGGFAPPPGGLCAWGFVGMVLVPQASWTVTHPLNTDKILCQIYDTSGNIVMPDNVEAVSISQVVITFALPQTGYANITGLALCETP